MAKIVKVEWTKRPARLIEEGPEVSVIEWLDTGTHQALANGQLKIVKSEISVADLEKKHRIVKPKGKRSEGPTKQELVNKLVADNSGLSRQDTIKLIIKQVGMTPAGAATYYYNAKKGK